MTIIYCPSDSKYRSPGKLPRERMGGRALLCTMFFAAVLAIAAGLVYDHADWTGAPQADSAPDATAPVWPTWHAFAQSVSLVTGITPVDSITDGAGSPRLMGAIAIATFERDGHTYAAVAAFADDSVQILNLTDPTDITGVDSITDRRGSLELGGAWGIVTFERDGHTYAAVAAQEDDGVQILNLTDPTDITGLGSITDSDDLVLDRIRGITTFEWGGHTYAAVAAYQDDGVQILNLTDLTDITGVGSITDSDDLVLDAAVAVATFERDGSLYAAVASDADNGVQILNLTDPTDITGVDSITDGTGSSELGGAWDIDIFERDGRLYAAVTANLDDGVQILDLTDPTDITGVDSITDRRSSPELDAAWDIDTFEWDGRLYAVVAADKDDGVQILDLTDPTDITGVDSITDSGSLVLRGASGIAIFYVDGVPYAAVAATYDDGVQILKLASDPAVPPTVIITGANPATVEAGTAYADAGATCLDETDGDLTDRMETHSDVNAAVPGEYEVTYACTDSVGNTVTAVRAVTVRDTTPPAFLSASYLTADGRLAVTFSEPLNSTAHLDLLHVRDAGQSSGGASLSGATGHVSGATLTATLTASQMSTVANLTAPQLDIDEDAVFDLAGIGIDGTADLAIILNHGNRPPTVDAGADQAANEGATVALSGTASDIDGDFLTYSWSHDSSLAIHLANSTAPSAAFTAPWVDSNATFTLTLAVSDGNATAFDSLNVTIVDTPQMPRGPRDIGRISLGNTDPGIVQASWEEPDREPASYRISWARAGQPYPTWTDLTGNAFPTYPFQAITGLEAGAEYKVKVRASYDGTAGDWSDEATVTVAGSPNNSPVVDAGSPRTAPEGSLVRLSGTAVDPDGDFLTYMWSHDQAAPAIWLSNLSSPSTTFMAPRVSSNSTVTLTLTASDGTWTASDSMNVAVVATSEPPRGPYDIGRVTVSSAAPGTVQASWEEPDREPANYRVSWARVDQPYPTWTDLTGNAFPTYPFQAITGLEAGAEYKVRVRANYDGTAGDWSEVTITAAGIAANTPAAGSPSITGTVQVGQMLTANIAGITDADGMTNSTLRYQWISNDGTADTDIAGATASSHVLAAGDQGRTIKVRVAFTDDAGHAESLTSAATQAVAPAFTVPGAPTSLSVLPNGSGTLAVSWQAPNTDGGSIITGYTVQWKTASGSWTVPADVTEAATTGTAHTIAGLTDGTPYAVRVLATNGIGNGEPTSEETATPQAPALGPRDIGVITLNGTTPGTIQVSWEEPGKEPANYRVMWAKVGEAYLTWTDSTGNAFPTVPSQAITDLEEGAQYKVKVRAVYDGTAGDWSAEVTVTVARTTTNTHATGLPAITGTTRVGQTLTADASGITDADGMTNSTLRYQWVSNDGTTDTDIAGATASSHVLAAGDQGRTIKVRVAFTDDAGHAESLTSAATQAVAPASTVPGSPQNLAVSTNGSGTLAVSWQAPASDGGSSITGYAVQWKTASGSWTVPADVTGAASTGTTHTITGLTDGTPYAVRVLATNGIGDGEPTPEETATPQAPAPPLGPRDIGVITLSSTTPGTIQASWDEPDEEPANYRVMWAKSGEPYLTWTDSTGNAFPTAPSHTITGLAEGVEYKMKVRASYDGTTGDWSGETTVTVASSTTNTATIPGSPQNLAVSTNGSGTLAVSWQAPASDGGSSITGYVVQWKTASGSWTVPADVTEAATTGTTHTITGLTDGTPYAVRVLATNGIGDGEPTPEETATPQAPAPPLGPRDIGVITLSSTTPGTIQASWDAPDEEPANYRVMWAKSGEPYLTWTDSSGNAFPTAPSHTITGLEEGVEYKMKVRASYDGTAGDWSGEVTITVARTG